MKRAKAYFTVEAALIMPLVLGCYLFVIGMMFFQYDRCVLEMNMARLAAWGAAGESGGEAATGLWEQAGEPGQGAYLWLLPEEPVVSSGEGTITVRGAGEFPLPGAGLFGLKTSWGEEIVYRVSVLDPAFLLRLGRGLREKLSQ